MKTTIAFQSQVVTVDLSKPIDISIALTAQGHNPTAWYIEGPKIDPVRSDDFVGNVSEGGSVNFNTITFNPHAHITHTECLGHITQEFHSVNKTLSQYFFLASLITIQPKVKKGDLVITKGLLSKALQNHQGNAVVIRTKPNHKEKRNEGALVAHKAFWNLPDAPRENATITEFIFVPNPIEDGSYVLNLQVAPMENDAAPSRPVLYAIENTKVL